MGKEGGRRKSGRGEKIKRRERPEKESTPFLDYQEYHSE
jgi:hypothetical protein